MIWSRGQSDRGAAAVEFALVFTMLMTLFLGIVEGSRMWYVQANLSQAAREGAREMAIHNNSTDAAELIENRASGLGVTVTGSLVPDVCSPGVTVEATASATVKSMTGLIDFAIPEAGIPMAGKAEMRCGG